MRESFDVRLARQVVAAHKRGLPTATNKDQVRRAIKAAEDRLARLLERDADK